MKNICIFLLFFLHFFAFGQSVMFSKYEKYDFDNKEGKYANMLKTECGNHCLFYEAPILRLDVWELN